MDLHPLIVIVVVFALAWAVLRWGALIFSVYAIWHLCAGEWTAAALALVFAGLLTLVKAPSVWWSRTAR